MNAEASLIGEMLWGFRFTQVFVSKGSHASWGRPKALLLFALLAPHYLLLLVYCYITGNQHFVNRVSWYGRVRKLELETRTTGLNSPIREICRKGPSFLGWKIKSVRFWTQSDHKLDPRSEVWSLIPKPTSCLKNHLQCFDLAEAWAPWTLCGFFFSEAYFMMSSWSSSSLVP